jgi:hypothetical protein
VIKWGVRNGRQRFFCAACKKLFIRKNEGASRNQKLKLFRKWVIGKYTLKELSRESKKSIDTLRILFKKFLDDPPKPQVKPNLKCHLTIDGTYFKNNFCLLNYYDNDLKRLQYYRTVERENYCDYLSDLEFLKQVGLNIVSITSDGQKGLIKAVDNVFPNVIHQRCIIHIQRLSLAYLTRNPKTQAGIILRQLVKHLHKIDNHDKRDYWIFFFNEWCKKCNDFLKDRSISASGRKWYTHKLLRRTRSLIKNALPDMFHYLDNCHIPKSTNGLESRFSYLKNNLKIHRGLNRKNRRSFIIWYNYFKHQN